MTIPPFANSDKSNFIHGKFNEPTILTCPSINLDFVDRRRFSVGHCYNWHAIYISHARLSLRHCYCVNGRLLSISGWLQGPPVVAIEWAN